MSELTLPRDQRLDLRSRAHHLDPVVLLGNAGLTDAVAREIDRALTAHELIKVRVPGDDRDQREAIFLQLAESLGAARVQAIGKLLVLYRPRPPEVEPAPAPRRTASGAVRSKAPKATRPAGRDRAAAKPGSRPARGGGSR